MLRNGPVGGDSSHQALIIQFQFPVERVGLTLSNGTDQTVASFQAFGETGESLSTVTQTGIEEIQGPFIGLATTADQGGISMLVVDYGEDPSPEQINELRFQYLTPRRFQTCIAQIVQAKIGTQQLRTLLRVQSAFFGAKGTLRLFDSKGGALELSLNGQLGSSFELTLPHSTGSGLIEFTSDGPEDWVRSGYACIDSNYPMLAQS
ncbi:MAG: hypothetical protein ACE5JX_08940, partial [Acidobacteriota bacterium]